jgi:glutaminyl-tRNA synthetase
MPTISGLRRRGYTPTAIRDFCDRIGVAKSNSLVDVGLLEHCIREDLNTKASRVMAVLKPLKLIIENYPEDMVEELEAENNSENPEMGTRKIPFSKVIYIEQDDFMENPPKKFFRLTPGQEVRLKHAYIIKCEQVIKDDAGEITELRCTYDPTTKSGESGSARKVKGVLHWVSAAHAISAEVRLYDYLLMDDQTNDDEYNMNPNSLITLSESLVEPSLAQVKPGDKFQFLRQGYFCMDCDSIPGKPVFNRIVGLRDTWAKLQK